MVVTATRVAQPKTTVSARVEVIKAEEIRKSGARTLAELLSQQGGVDVRSYGAVGAVSAPSLRGSAAGQVLVMVDGRRLNSPLGEGVDLGDISLTGVQRVEILHGGASSLYGSDAIGGVINIITNPATGPTETRTLQSLGAFGLRSWSLGRTETLKPLSYTFSLQRLVADNDFGYRGTSGAERSRVNADYRQTAIRLRLTPKLSLPGKLDLSGEWSDSFRGVPGIIQSPSLKARQRDRTRVLDLAYRGEEGRDGGYNGRVYYQQTARRYDDPKSFPAPTHTTQDVDTLGVELLGRRRFSAGQSLTVGLESRTESLSSNAVGKRDRKVHALYGQHQATFGAWTLLPALRLDVTEGFSPRLSPHLGVIRRLGGDLELKANAGGSFRTPGLNDLYWPADPYSLGNPKLSPESASTYDLGLTYTRGPLNAGVSVFRTVIRDLIVWTPGALVPGKWSPINVGKSETQGIEMDAGTKLGRLSTRASLTFLDPRDHSGQRNADGRFLIFRPLSQGRLNLDYDAGPWGAAADFTFTGRRYITPDNLRHLGSFTTTDLRLRHALGRTVALELQVLNLWDKRYELQPGYPMPGREWRIRLTELW
ncbi:MAG TPA: TonB-dependent receptor [Armatimonadota bacterium]